MQVSDLNAGKAGEHLVCADLILKGYEAFLSDQGLPYDVVADINGRLMKIQVKTTRTFRAVPQRAEHTPAYIFHIHRCGKGGKQDYRTSGIDLFALVALDCGVVGYILPDMAARSMVFRAESYRGRYHDEKILERREQILLDFKSGVSKAEIARRYGMHPTVVGRTINSNVLPKMTEARYLSEMVLEKVITE